MRIGTSVEVGASAFYVRCDRIAGAVALMLAGFVILAGKPVLALGGSARDRVELAKGLRAGLLEEEG